jgi:type IV secretion system protein VirB4
MFDSLLKKFKKDEDNSLEFDIKSDMQAQKSNQLLLESPAPNFIPYACHYDKKTILTKNGELLQTIKIVGFTFEKLGGVSSTLREVVREAVEKHIQTSDFALCFNTIRKKKNLDPNPKFQSFFSNKLHEKWVDKNKWHDKYINELHITIIRGGVDLKVSALTALANLGYSRIKSFHDQELVKASKQLDQVVDNLLDSLSSYGAERLELVYDEQYGYHSELLEFFGNIIHLDSSPMSLPMGNLSEYLARYKVAFGNDALEVKKDNSKFFAAILSIKDYQNLSTEAIDLFLQLEQQFVVTQTLNFIPVKKAIKKYRYQDYLLRLSRDEDMRSIIGVDKVMSIKDVNSQVSFCESQVTIMIVAEKLDQLEQEVKRAYHILSNIGLSVVREDLNLEHCFWSQLPGNFYYITRKAVIPSNTLGGFASLHNFPAGSLTSKWGNAISLLKTAIGTPYFFNFHVGNNGHTMIVGDASAGKGTMVNFLLSEASKLSPNVFYMDFNRESEIFVHAMGGTYLVFDYEKTDVSAGFNPLHIEDNNENREFLKFWFLLLADKYVDTNNIDQYSKAIESAVNKIYSLPQEKRILRNIAEFFSDPNFAQLNADIINRTSNWYGEGKFAHIFDNEKDSLVYTNNMIGIDMTKIYDTDMSENLPVLSYLLHFFKIHFLGTPSVLSVTNANRIFGSIYFEKNLANILDDLTERNSIMIATASFASQKVKWSRKVADIFHQKMATKFFLPDDSDYGILKEVFKLTDQEEMYLEALDPNNRQFIIRQSDVSIVSELNLRGFDPELDLLSSSEEFAKKCFDLMVDVGRDPQKWVPKIHASIAEEKRRAEEEESVLVDCHNA